MITLEHLQKIAGVKTPLMAQLVEPLNRICPSYGIDTFQEFAHFLAQACCESDHFRTLKEYASGKEYEGRKDLGNTIAGYGVKFKGRGMFQTTGYANYYQLGVIKGEPKKFINNPELLETPEYAVWSACEYWKTRGFNDISNHLDTDKINMKYHGKIVPVPPIEYISVRVNGGYNGYPSRLQFYANAKKVFGI
jgi:putative chitinase